MNRCSFCNKKSHILNVCLCKNKYCFSHLQPEIHKCILIEEFRKKSFEKNKKDLLENKIETKKIETI